MYKQDYIITICFDNNGEAYWNVTKKGEQHKCNTEELKMISSTFNFLRKQIDSVTGHSEVPSIVKWAYEKD
jgi:hypothetical protein